MLRGPLHPSFGFGSLCVWQETSQVPPHRGQQADCPNAFPSLVFWWWWVGGIIHNVATGQRPVTGVWPELRPGLSFVS
jgi:hypothetical protein